MIEKSFLLALIGVITWTLSLWTTNDAELYCNSLYTGPVLDSVGVKVNKNVLILTTGIIGTVLGAIGFYQIFFADFINYLGIMAPPLAGRCWRITTSPANAATTSHRLTVSRNTITPG